METINESTMNSSSYTITTTNTSAKNVTTSDITPPLKRCQKSVEHLELEHDKIDAIINHAKKNNHDKEVLEDLHSKRRKLSSELFDAYIYGEE